MASFLQLVFSIYANQATRSITFHSKYLEKLVEQIYYIFNDLIKPAINELMVNFLWILFKFKSYDLFRIYKLKGTKYYAQNRAKYEIYTDRKLALPGRYHMNKFRFIFLMWYIYFLFKCFHLYIYSRITHKAGFNRNDYKDSSFFNYLVWFNKLMGNPYYELHDMAFVLYIDRSTIIFYHMFILALFYQKVRPIDIPRIRFLYDPKRELDRIDLIIKRQINELLKSIQFCKYQISNEDLKPHSIEYLRRKDLETLNEKLSKYKRHLMKYVSGPEAELRFEKLRLITYGKESWLAFKSTVTLLIVIPLTYYYYRTIASERKVLNKVRLMRCAPQTGCSLMEIFSWPDLVTLSEIMTLKFLFFLSITLHNAMYIGITSNQFRLVRELRSNLNDCRNQFIVSNLVKTQNSFDRSNQLLIDTIIKVKTIQEELVRGIQNLTLMTSLDVFESLRIILLYMLISGATYKETSAAKSYIVWFTLIYKNCMCIIFASINAMIVKQEKLFWYILKEKMENERIELDLSETKRSKSNRLRLDFLFLAWKKLTFLQVKLQDSFVVEATELIKVNYQSILQIDFNILSLYSYKS